MGEAVLQPTFGEGVGFDVVVLHPLRRQWGTSGVVQPSGVVPPQAVRLCALLDACGAHLKPQRDGRKSRDHAEQHDHRADEHEHTRPERAREHCERRHAHGRQHH